MPASLTELNDDLTRKILFELPARQLLNAAQACRRLYQVESVYEATLWQALVHVLQPPSASASFLDRQPNLRWKDRYRMLHRRGCKQPVDAFHLHPSEKNRRMAAIHCDFEFAVELSESGTGAVLVSVVVPTWETLAMPSLLSVPSTFGGELILTTNLFFIIDGPSVARLPIGLRPLDLAGGTRTSMDAYGDIQVNVYVRRRADDRVAAFASAVLNMNCADVSDEPQSSYRTTELQQPVTLEEAEMR